MSYVIIASAWGRGIKGIETWLRSSTDFGVPEQVTRKHKKAWKLVVHCIHALCALIAGAPELFHSIISPQRRFCGSSDIVMIIACLLTFESVSEAERQREHF
jgi:hypothetical protein